MYVCIDTHIFIFIFIYLPSSINDNTIAGDLRTIGYATLWMHTVLYNGNMAD